MPEERSGLRSAGSRSQLAAVLPLPQAPAGCCPAPLHRWRTVAQTPFPLLKGVILEEPGEQSRGACNMKH